METATRILTNGLLFDGPFNIFILEGSGFELRFEGITVVRLCLRSFATSN